MSIDNSRVTSMHSPAQQLVRYVLGELDRPSAERVRRHTAQCAECGDQLAALILLRGDHAESEAAPATLSSGVVPWRRLGGIAAAAAILLVGIGVGMLLPEPGEGAAGTTAANAALVHETAEDLSLVFGHEAVAAGAAAGASDAAPQADAGRIADALVRIRNGDAGGAAVVLADFGTRWDRFGTGLLAMTRFIDGAGDAGTLLEFYVAGHPNGELVRGAARGPEDVALFFLAQSRLASGDPAGAREALAWIAPDSAVRAEATRWAERALGED